MKCPNCGGESTTKFCPFCGSEMPYRGPDNVSDDHSTTIINNYYYQPPTGAPNMAPASSGVSDKSRTATLVLCLILGVFGGHNYYAGKIGMGILYTFTYGLFGIGWLVDLIRILCGSYTDSYGRPILNW